jgi:hypothetical protein
MSKEPRGAGDWLLLLLLQLHKKTKWSKIHAVVTYTSLPVGVDLGRGNEPESRRLFSLLKNMRIKGTQKPRSRSKQVYADNKYDTPLVVMYLWGRGISARSKERVNRKRRMRPGRPRLFDYEKYSKIRSSVERFFSWLKSFRMIQTRYDRLAASTMYFGFEQLRCAVIYWRGGFPDVFTIRKRCSVAQLSDDRCSITP